MGVEVGVIAAFVAGIASCLSPCVAPLIPGYLALLSGSASVTQGQRRTATIPRLLVTSVCFVAGFTLVFVTLGAAVSTLGAGLGDYRRPLARVSGVLMIVMGFVMLGVLRLPWLLRERRWHIQPRAFRPSETLLLGMAFGFGWTPCFGPVLAVILVYASTVDTVRQGTLLLFAYALGLGLPFIALGVGVGWSERLLHFTRRVSGPLNLVSGATLLVLGWLFVTDRFFFLNIATQRLYYRLIGG